MKRIILFPSFALIIIASLFSSSVSNAQPYGAGIYNADVPYGDETSLSISTNGNISIPITPNTGGSLATGTSAITVTSTDVMGFKLYIRALDSTDMNNFGAVLPASSNETPTTLEINTWGYNTDASNNFTGITLSDVLIRSIAVPASDGNITNVTYGMNLDLSKPAGNYVTNIIYTAVPQTN